MEMKKTTSFYERKTQATDELTQVLKQMRIRNQEKRINDILIYFENKYGFSRLIRDRIIMAVENKEFIDDNGVLVPIRNDKLMKEELDILSAKPAEAKEGEEE